jgi:hypothetical protein
MSTPARLAAVIASVLLAIPERVLAQGCAMCRTALPGQNDPLGAAFNTSILFMMAMPYLIVGSVGGWIYLASRRRHDPTLTASSVAAGAKHDSVEGENQ